MNAKQFLMIVTLFSYATNGVSATVIQTCNAEQIVSAIMKEKLTVDDYNFVWPRTRRQT